MLLGQQDSHMQGRELLSHTVDKQELRMDQKPTWKPENTGISLYLGIDSALFMGPLKTWATKENLDKLDVIQI